MLHSSEYHCETTQFQGMVRSMVDVVGNRIPYDLLSSWDKHWEQM